MVTGAWFLAGLFLVAVAFLFHRVARKGTDDLFNTPARIILTTIMIAMMVVAARISPALGLFVVITCGLVLSIFWVPSIVSAALGPLLNSMTGGNEEVDPKPFYHRARALRKKGDYPGAIAEVETQLAAFPDDFEGKMMLAEIQSDDLKNLPIAQGLLTEMLVTSGRADHEQILILNRKADLHLRDENPVAAAENLHQIIARWPETESARFAEQRLSHLPPVAMLAAKRDRPTVKLREYEQNIGLRQEPATADAPFASPTEKAGELVRRLAEYPDDWETREELARLYVDELQRPELAVMELEALIQSPHQSDKSVAKWLNQLADVHQKIPGHLPASQAALEQIIQRFPDTFHADTARMRLARLVHEASPNSERPALKLGNYEQNIGLKPHHPPPPPESNG